MPLFYKHHYDKGFEDDQDENIYNKSKGKDSVANAGPGGVINKKIFNEQIKQ